MSGWGQTALTPPLRFEVASVKPCPKGGDARPGGRKGDGGESSPVRLHLPCQTLLSLIQWAYGNYAQDVFNPLASVSISGGPGWMETERFQVDAKPARAAKSGVMNGAMLRALVEERFQLEIRREVREAPVYALTVRKGKTPRIARANGRCIVMDPEHPAALGVEPGKPFPAVCGMASRTAQGYQAWSVTMKRFAELLSDFADRKVVDRSGLAGEFDIHLELEASDPAEMFATVRSALERQGLRLEPARAAIEEIRVVRAVRPEAN